MFMFFVFFLSILYFQISDDVYENGEKVDTLNGKETKENPISKNNDEITDIEETVPNSENDDEQSLDKQRWLIISINFEEQLSYYFEIKPFYTRTLLRF